MSSRTARSSSRSGGSRGHANGGDVGSLGAPQDVNAGATRDRRGRSDRSPPPKRRREIRADGPSRRGRYVQRAAAGTIDGVEAGEASGRPGRATRRVPRGRRAASQLGHGHVAALGASCPSSPRPRRAHRHGTRRRRRRPIDAPDVATSRLARSTTSMAAGTREAVRQAERALARRGRIDERARD